MESKMWQWEALQKLKVVHVTAVFTNIKYVAASI